MRGVVGSSFFRAEFEVLRFFVSDRFLEFGLRGYRIVFRFRRRDLVSRIDCVGVCKFWKLKVIICI